MTESEIIIKTQAIASVFNEYLIYFEPIYQASISRQGEKMPRAKRREYNKSAMADYHKLKTITARFARMFENKYPNIYEMSVDAICEVLNHIKIEVNEKDDRELQAK